MVLEAKHALFSGNKMQEGEKLHTIQKEVDAKPVEGGQEEPGKAQLTFNSFPSPNGGTQEAPQEAWSSQEEGREDNVEMSTFIADDGELQPIIAREEENLTSGVLDEVYHSNTSREVVGDETGDKLEETNEKDRRETIKAKVNKDQEHPQGEVEVRQSQRVKDQGMGNLKVAEKAEALTRKKNLEELQKEEDAVRLENAAQVIKTTALMFHPKEAATDDTGMVLLQ